MENERKSERTGLDLLNDVRNDPDSAPQWLQDEVKRVEELSEGVRTDRAQTVSANSSFKISEYITASLSALLVLLNSQQVLLTASGIDDPMMVERLLESEAALQSLIDDQLLDSDDASR